MLTARAAGFWLRFAASLMRPEDAAGRCGRKMRPADAAESVSRRFSYREMSRMRTVVSQLSTFSFLLVCVASSILGVFLLPTVTVATFDLMGLSTEAPLSNFVGWSILASAAVGFLFPTTVLMSARGEFD
jgi:lysylphosphatidylglycerol synthetase-like protein (DUF2156 family)